MFKISSPSLFNSNTFVNMSPDKITSVIQHWNLKFDGSTSALSVQEFIYRVE